LELGNGCIERIDVGVPFLGGSVASKSDLIRLRSRTVQERASQGEIDDLRWLVQVTAASDETLAQLDRDNAIAMMEAASHLPLPDVLLLAALLGSNNSRLAMALLASRL